MATRLTHERLLEVLRYNKTTGVFVWKKKLSDRCPVGTIAGSSTALGYIAIRIDGERFQAHRLAWFYVVGKWPKDQIDHRNGIRNDNRFRNLREATASQNGQNEHAIRRNNTSGVPGVFWIKSTGRWLVRLVVKRHRVYVGVFKTMEEAVVAKREAKARLHPFFEERSN